MENILEQIKKIVINDDACYGLRADDFDYQIGDVCHKSHQLYQDAMYADDDAFMRDEPLYPYCEDGIYKGYYDAGELNGTCAVSFNIDDEDSIMKAIETVDNYFGDYIYLIKGEYAENGNDVREVIISNTVVVGKFKH